MKKPRLKNREQINFRPNQAVNRRNGWHEVTSFQLPVKDTLMILKPVVSKIWKKVETEIERLCITGDHLPFYATSASSAFFLSLESLHLIFCTFRSLTKWETGRNFRAQHFQQTKRDAFGRQNEFNHFLWVNLWSFISFKREKATFSCRFPSS